MQVAEGLEAAAAVVVWAADLAEKLEARADLEVAADLARRQEGRRLWRGTGRKHARVGRRAAVEDWEPEELCL